MPIALRWVWAIVRRMLSGLAAILLAGAAAPTVRDCSSVMKDLTEFNLSPVLQETFQEISQSNLFVWVPAKFLGKPPQIFAEQSGARPFFASSIGTRRFLSQLARSKNAQLRRHYRRMLPSQMFSAWQEAEGNLDRNFAHDFYIVRREGRGFRVVFHLRLFEAVFDRASAVPLPAEVLEKSLGGHSHGQVLALARAFRQLSLMKHEDAKARGESFVELGQYLVDATPEEAIALKQMAVSFLIQLFFKERRDRLFVFVPASPLHERLYSQDFGLKTRQDQWGHWVKGQDLMQGLKEFLRRSEVQIILKRKKR